MKKKTFLSNTRQLELITAWQRHRHPAAHDELTASYLPIIDGKINSLRIWNHDDLPRQDLAAIGWSALLQAIETFDTRTEQQFYDHAQRAIEYALYRHVVDGSRRAA